MTIIYRELFINAFLEAEQITNKEYLNKDDFNFEFSDKFEKRMQKLVAKENRINFQSRRIMSKCFLAAIIAIIVMFTGLMSVSASRQKIIEFVETIFPKYTQVELSEESLPTPDTIETAYTLGFVPDGYELVQYNQDKVSVFAIWENENEEEIVFSQDILNSNTSIDSEHYYETLDVNGYKAYIFGMKNLYSLTWKDDNYMYTITVPREFKDNLIDIAKSIEENN